MMTRQETFNFKVLVRREEDYWVAHCLELDLVTEAETQEQVCDDMKDVITAQVLYALEHDNMEYLYRSAPQEVWNAYSECQAPKKKSPFAVTDISGLVTPLIETNTCFIEEACHA